MANRRQNRGRPQVARASGRTVELAVQRALAELDFAPGELREDQYEVTIIIPPEEGFLGVGGVDAVVEVALVGEEWEYLDEEGDSLPPELLKSGLEGGERDRERVGEWLEGDDESGFAGAFGSDSPEAARLRRFLERVLDELGLVARIQITERDEYLLAEISGDDLGIFIGRRGQTMDAIEYLAGIAVSAASSRQQRVELDAEGYKERRRRQIERLALRKADEVVKRGRPVQLAPMTAAERKIVHVSLKSRNDVTTASQGREPNRAVIISPVRAGGR